MNPRLALLAAWTVLALLALTLVTFRPPGQNHVPLRAFREEAVSLVESVTLDPIELWPEGAPGEQLAWHAWIGPEEHPAYINHPSGYRGFGIFNVTRPTLTPFIARNGRGAMVVAPGGGYHDLCYSIEGLDVARRFNGMGVSVFLLKYRVPRRPRAPRLPWNWAALQDAQRAMGIVRGRAAEWKIDPDKIAFMGFSAGGHLSASIATRWQRRMYDAVDQYDEVSCRPDVSLLIYPWALVLNSDPSSGRLGAEIRVTESTPPAFLAGAEDDRIAWPEGMVLYDEHLNMSGVPSELHVYQTGSHGFAMCQTRVVKGDFCTWVDSAQLFLQRFGIAPRVAGGTRI